MIDITLNLTIDEDHEEDFEQILKCVENIPGVEKLESVEGSYFEYNIDSEPWYEEEEE